jgi:hypothetical protein
MFDNVPVLASRIVISYKNMTMQHDLTEDVQAHSVHSLPPKREPVFLFSLDILKQN